MNRKTTWNRIKKPHASLLYELYHENSKGNLFWTNKESTLLDDSTEYKKHNSLPLLSILEKGLPDTTIDVHERMVKEDIQSENILDYLSLLFQKMYGFSVSQQSDFLERVISSRSDIFPLEIYCYVDKIEEVEQGLWHYNLDENSISLLKYVNDIDQYLPLAKPRKFPIIMFVTSVMDLAKELDGERAYRNVLIETGKVLQNAFQFSKQMNVLYSEIGKYNEFAIERILNIDGLNHMLLSVCVLDNNN